MPSKLSIPSFWSAFRSCGCGIPAHQSRRPYPCGYPNQAPSAQRSMPMPGDRSVLVLWMAEHPRASRFRFL
jgi:hypothetical protein